jgi:hypothetical protein
VSYYFGFWAVAPTMLYAVLLRHVYDPIAGGGVQLLWFLRAYVLVLATMPVLHRITTTAWLTAIGNSGAMTLYLWHMPVLLGVHLLFDSLGHPRYPGQPPFLAISVVQPLMMVAVVAVLFLTLRPLENNPLPGWDGAPTITSVWRGTAVGTLLCVAGVAPLPAIRWGLKDDGLVCVAVMATALVSARVLATGGSLMVRPRAIPPARCSG